MTTKKGIKVLIADDHMVVREGLKKLLLSDSDIQVIGEAKDGDDALEKIRATQPDVVLLDIQMPGKSGFDVLVEINREFPDIRVLVLSMYSEEHHEMRMLKAGAYGYLTKEGSKDQLLNAVRAANRGEKLISPLLTQKLASNFGKEMDKEPHENLTDREYQIFLKIAAGQTVSEIADELCLSVKTISGHRANILRKMQMTSNAQLTRYVIKSGLI